jgi:hypothetical protein
MRRGGFILALVTVLGTSVSALLVASPAMGATTNSHTEGDNGGQQDSSGCPGFPPGTSTCPSLITNAAPTSVVAGQPVTDVASFGVDPVGDVTFYVCGPSATDCQPAQGILVGTAPVQGTSASMTYTPLVAGNYSFFAVFHNSGVTIPEDTDDSSEHFTVTSEPSTASSSSSSQLEPASTGADGPPTTPSAPTATERVVAGATTVHTGQPWAGTRPFELGAGGLGAALAGLGMRRRRSARAPRVFSPR